MGWKSLREDLCETPKGIVTYLKKTYLYIQWRKSHKFLFGSGALSQSQHAPASVHVTVFVMPISSKEVPEKLEAWCGSWPYSPLIQLWASCSEPFCFFLGGRWTWGDEVPASQATDFKRSMRSMRRCLWSTRHFLLLMISMRNTPKKWFLTWGDV